MLYVRGFITRSSTTIVYVAMTIMHMCYMAGTAKRRFSATNDGSIESKESKRKISEKAPDVVVSTVWLYPMPWYITGIVQP